MMIQFKLLTSKDYSRFYANISQMNTMVFEELYYYAFGKNAPYDYYHADYIVSPKCKYHYEYFRKVKPVAIELYKTWYSFLVPHLHSDDIVKLKQLGVYIRDAKDMIELVWYAQLLLKAVLEYKRKQRIVVGEST